MNEPMDDAERGREAFGRRMWGDAFQHLSRADEASPLGAGDLELLAQSAFLTGHDDEFAGTMDRAYRSELEAGDPMRAARVAFWLGFTYSDRGELGRATGWFGRAARLIERQERDCAERGYLLLPSVLENILAGNHETALAEAEDAAKIGERFAEPDLVAMAVLLQGLALANQGRVEEGLALLDEVMVAATSDELSPSVTGTIYCATIEVCRRVYELRRSLEWTAALTHWVEGQPDLVPFAGQCLVHRAEIMRLRGEWRNALDEALRAQERFALGSDQSAAAAALYEQGEIHRLLGEFDDAERAYRDASRKGLEPHPGLALLRLSQGDREAATAAIRRLVDESADPLERARLLPAFIEIILVSGDVEAARRGCRELEEIAMSYSSSVLGAIAGQAKGAVELADGDAGAALVALRSSARVWQEFEAPYEAARVRVLVARACEDLGDRDSSALELDAARRTFERLGAAPDLARVESIVRQGGPEDSHGLAPRELEVLRLVAAGKTNRAIAAELIVSERTVERHVSNIFNKLQVSSRTAAAAYAYENHLV
jgi:ATP/maltotriose-dependent transcriptional regulator MalT